jgi:hypothetical protein
VAATLISVVRRMGKKEIGSAYVVAASVFGDVLVGDPESTTEKENVCGDPLWDI